MLTLKGGIWGTVQRRFDLHFFPVQRRLRSSQQTLNST
jgi:hypothetical protein